MESRSFLDYLMRDVSRVYACAFYLGLVGAAVDVGILENAEDAVAGYYDGQRFREYLFALERRCAHRERA